MPEVQEVSKIYGAKIGAELMGRSDGFVGEKDADLEHWASGRERRRREDYR